MSATRFVRLVGIVALTTAASSAHAQLALSSNENKVVLVNGVQTVVPNPPPDTLTLIDLGASPPRVITEIEAPASVVGPPVSVALTPDESLALITASMKLDPADPKKTVPGDRMAVVDLKATPPRVVATLETGKGPSGVSINRQGTLALVANRHDGTVSIFTIQGKTVAAAGSLPLGDEKSLLGHAAFTPDGKTALVTRGGDNKVSVLSIDGVKVEYTKYDMVAGVRPTALDIAASGAFAVVGNIGAGGGDADTVSLINLTMKPPRVVDTVTVGPTPEGAKLSPDGSIVAVVTHNGSTKPKTSPFYNDAGKLVLLRVSGDKLSRVAEAPIGHWSQGAAFSADGKTIVVQNMVEKEIQVFAWDGTTLRDTGARIKTGGGPAAIRTAEK